ncbi:hypothetical protein JIG36_29825 [Actinoplanes sp. LDG1-06]|uniref:Uncharacterized protein n=1 Tax=Paractinoplanes ovalisporus TaxID=2810368 RepID=A0ABS2AIU6_9ACTN|nr:hypothetical protein [Actinoplanes ovalisporus]MBM2619715.1 hypothetical protein [Actinoplanes ovalisporus]
MRLTRRASRLTIVAALVAAVVTVAGSTWAAFTGTTANSGNTLVAGSVVLSDDDSGSALFSTGGLKPNASVVNCVQVSYTGSLPATVRLFASATSDTTGPSGTGLLDYLRVRVEESSTGSFGCAGFGSPATIWDTSVSTFPTTYAGGFPSALSSWPTGTSRTYRFTVTVEPTVPDSSDGSSATATFTWEAHNT